MNSGIVAFLLFLLIASLGIMIQRASADVDSDLHVTPLTQHFVVDLVFTNVVHFTFNVTNSGNEPRPFQIQHQPLPEWPERDDYQMKAEPEEIDTVWITMAYNGPISNFNGTTYTAYYAVIADHANVPGDYVAANVTITWTVITSWNGRYCPGSGKVLDAETSAPILGAYVGFGIPGEIGIGPGNPFVSQADGSYSTDRVFRGISCTAVVMARGYQTYVNADYYVPLDSQPPIQQNFELIPSGMIGNYSLEWNSTLLSPVYYGAISSDFKTVILAGGEHITASYHASTSPSFSSQYYFYMFDTNGTLLWRFGPLTNSSDYYGGFWSAAITGDGSLAAAGTTDGQLFVFNRHGLLWNVTRAPENASCAQFEKFSPNGNYLLDGVGGGGIEYRNATTGAILWTAPVYEVANPRAFLFSADGGKLLVGTSVLRMFDTANGTLLWARATSGFIWPTAIAATPDFSFIVVGTGKGGSIWTYDGDGNVKWEFDAADVAVNWVSMSSDGSVIAVGARDGLRVFNRYGKLLWGISGLTFRLPWLGDVTAGAVTPDGRYILAGTDGSTIYQSDTIPNGALLFDVNGTLLWSDFWNTTATKWSPLDFGKPTFAAISSDASTFICGSTDSMVRAYHGAVVATPTPKNITLIVDHTIQVDGEVFHVVTDSNSTVSDLVLDESQIEFSVSGDSGAVGYFNVIIPKSLMNCTGLDGWVVRVNGTQLLPPDFSTPTENATHTFIHFTCTFASTLQVTIEGTYVVPEFSSPTILLLSIVMTLLVIIVCKRGNGKRSRLRIQEHLLSAFI